MTTTLNRLRACAIAVALALAACSQNDPAALIASAKTYLGKSDPAAASIQLKNALQKAPDNAEARFLLATALLRMGDAAAAETEVRKAIELKYPFDQTYPLLARALVAQGQFRKVIELGDRAVADPKSRADLLTSVGLAQLGLNNIDGARKALTEAAGLTPDDPRTVLAQAQVAAHDGDLAGALRLVDGALAKHPNDIDAALFKSRVQAAMGQREAAVKTLEQLSAAHPEAPGPRYALVSMLITTGKIDGAGAHVTKLKEQVPNDPRTSYAEALWAYAKGDGPRAREAVQRVLAVMPEHLPSLMLSGLVQLQQRSYAGAEDTLRRVVTRAPGEPNARRALAVVYVRTGRAALALETLDPLLRADTPDAQVWRAAGEAAIANGDAAGAGRYFERAASLDKDNVGTQVRLAQVRMVTGETDRAFRDLESLSASDATQYEADLALIAGHLRRREFDKALAAADNLVKKLPDNPISYSVRGSVYLAKRDLGNARTSFDKALAIDPKNFTAAYNLAMLDVREGKAPAAKERYDRILAKDPTNEQVLLAQAELATVTGTAQDGGRALIQKAIDAHPTSVRPRLALIGLLIRQKDTRGAVTAAQAAQAAIPGDAQIDDALGAAQLAAGNANQALETFRVAAQARPQNAAAQLRLAEAQLAGKDLSGAVVSARKAVALQPSNAQAWLLLAKLLMASGRADEAVAEARKLQKERPNQALGYALEGEIQGMQKKNEEALAAYKQALAKEPTSFVVGRVYTLLLASGKAVEANALADKWNREHPKDATLRVLIAQQSQARNDVRGAIAQYRGALELDPENVVILNNLAWLLTQQKDPAAREYAERAYRVAPFNPNVMDTLGWTLVSLGSDVKRGTELLRMAANLAPGENEIRLHLGAALAKSGDKAAARSQLEPLTKLDASSPLRVEAEKTLSTL